MLNLRDREWNAFPLTGIFEIKAGKRLTKSDMKSGKRPFIGATEYENGVTNWVANTNASLDSNVLGVNYNGSVVETFYHPYECIFSDDVKRFRLKNLEGNRLVYLFLKTAITQQKSKYAYGYKFNEQRMNKQSILLPITADGSPDWAFMEQYIHEREEKLITDYKVYIAKNERERERETDRDTERLIPRLQDKKWKAFLVVDYFFVSTGTENNMDSLKAGDIPLVSAKKTDNGLKSFVKAEKVKQGNVIAWNKDGDGGAGLAHYQPSAFAADSHILVLSPKMPLSPHVGFFISTALSQYYGIFGHGRANSLQRVTKTKIMLPASGDGSPDWDYMEQYGKAVFAHQSKEYFSYLESRV
jgi:hypothetical protein